MKLSVSNIAWYPKRIDEFIELLCSYEIDGVEIAASMLWDEPANAGARERKELRNKVEGAGLAMVGLQSLLYTRRDLQLFSDAGTRRKITEYFKDMMNLCADLGGNILVFGSPNNRNMGNLSKNTAWDIAVHFFGRVGNIAKEQGVKFCIEPLGRSETDFINSVAEVEKLIEQTGCTEGLGLHIDTKGLMESGDYKADYLSESFSRACHAHISEPGLAPIGSSGFDHKEISERIIQSGYSNFISIEMRRSELNVSKAIQSAVEYVKRVYFNRRSADSQVAK